MKNGLRTLLFNGEVSFTVANLTELVQTGIRLHRLSPASARVFGKALCALTYMSACLKETRGEVSLSIQCGDGKTIGASGNKALYMRGYIDNTTARTEEEILGEEGAFTVVRDDGYNRPFVGTCAFPHTVEIDRIVEEYYKISEQLPTRVATQIDLDGKGDCIFAGLAVLQPLPFASEESLRNYRNVDLYACVNEAKTGDLTALAKSLDPANQAEISAFYATYKCKCSRAYLAEVLTSLGRAQVEEIIASEGGVRVHCHYCNTDYEFTDSAELFDREV